MSYLGHAVLLVLVVIGQTMAMSTCSEKNGSRFLNNEQLEGSYLEDLASRYFWATLGVEPDKTGFTSIFLEFGDLLINEAEQPFLYLDITRTFNNLTSTTFRVTWTQEEDSYRFFDAVYPDGQYNIYHFYYKGLIVFHRCSVTCIEDGNVSFTVFAPIEQRAEETRRTANALRSDLLSKFPEANVIYLDYPLVTDHRIVW